MKTIKRLSLIFLILLLTSSGGIWKNREINTLSYFPSASPRENRVILSFSGDVIQHMSQLSAALTTKGEYDFSRTFAYIDIIWKTVDFAIVNFETTISANGQYSGYPQFSSPPHIAEALHKSGVDVAALANNHICDKGYAGMEKTIHTLKKIGIKTTGAYMPATNRNILILNKNNFRIALLNYTYSTNGFPIPRGGHVNTIDTAAISRDIEMAKEDSKATHIIAFMHWGEEYQRKSNKTQQKIGLWMRKKGVDAVVGSHPHVVQEIDTINKIVYSLGNFISNQQDRYTDSGLTVLVTLQHDTPAHLAYIPHWCDKMASIPDKEKYRVLTEKDTVLNTGEALIKMRKALLEAREAAGKAQEYKFR